MYAIQEKNTIDLHHVEADPYWNVAPTAEAKMHRIHAYPAKFPALIASQAINYAEEKGRRPNKIADIFCGCGTTAYEAKKREIDFWGCDINPVATLIAKTKSRTYLDVKIAQYLQQILRTYSKIEFTEEHLFNQERMRYWFDDNAIISLSRIKNSIAASTPVNSKYRNFFLCAFSNILKPSSKWLTKSIKPQVDPNKISPKPIDSFIKQVKFMRRANAESDLSAKTSQASIVTGSVICPKRKIENVDLIITSPPYVTSYEYADLHQLSSIWLDFTNDYRSLRKGSIGSLYSHQFSVDMISKLNMIGTEVVSGLRKANNSKYKAVAKYYSDIQQVAIKSLGMLNPNGMALFVIGNTEYSGVRITNAEHLSLSLIEAGFSKVEVSKREIRKKILTPYRNEKGKFTRNKNGKRVYSEEYIIVGYK